jgi:hypothetical protein
MENIIKKKTHSVRILLFLEFLSTAANVKLPLEL